MKRNFRLTRSIDFKRVRSAGKSYAHPLVVLVVAPTDDTGIRIGVTASKNVGGSVQRNRSKRLLREAVRPLLANLKPADVMLIARLPLVTANLVEISQALTTLFNRARLLTEDEANES